MPFNPKHQESENGPLTKSFRERVNKVRTEKRITLAQLGGKCELSGPTLSNILRHEVPARIRSHHVPRLVKAIDELEGWTTSTEHAPHLDGGHQDDLWFSDVIRAAHKRGFNVIFSPLK